jgi:hypothetical protein
MDIEGFGSGKNLHRFTPVRRRESTINTRQFQGDYEQEWTAARCHRLLRALTSRVAILKKELACFSSVPQYENDQGRESARRGKEAVNKGDEDWARARKRIRSTYSKKSTRNDSGLPGNVQKARGLPSKMGRESLVPGEIAIPTPILARARGELPEEKTAPIIPDVNIYGEPISRNKRSKTRCVANDGGSQFQLSESLLDLRKRITATRYTTYEGIYGGLEALLRATNMADPKRKGSSSLLSMSLRAIPRYIAQQEALLRDHMEETGSKSAIENRDISTEIYSELENFGSSGNGWKRLRITVRSHGIQVLSDAMSAGLLDVEFSGALIALCVNTSAIDEAQTLLSALLSFKPFPSPKTLYDIANRPLNMLWKFTGHTGRSSFQYRQLSAMVSNHILPVEWLATKEFGPVWTGVVHSLSPHSDNFEALMFLDLALTMLSEVGTSPIRGERSTITEAAKNTFCSLLTTLSSVVILSKGAAISRSTKEVGLAHEYEHVSSLLRSCLVQQSHSKPALDRQSHLILLANLLVHDKQEISADSDDSLICSLLRYLMRSEEGFVTASAVYTSLIEFICLVARCCGRGVSSSGFEHLEHLHQVIESSVYDVEGGNILKGVIVDSAFTFAQQVPDHKHIDYATVMDEKFCARRFWGEDSLLSASSRGSEEGRSEFRWEEGIGEWVTATPAIKNSKKCVAEGFSMTDSENDTPFRPPPKLRRRKALAKESSVDPPSPACKGDLEEYADMSDLSMQTSKGALKQLGHLESARSMSHRSSSRSDGSLKPESIGSALEVDASSLEDSFVSDNSSPSASPDSARSAMGHEALNRAPGLSRRLLDNTQDWNFFDDSSVSSALSLLQDERDVSKDAQRDYVERAPRLGRRALRSSQAWQIFDESDDELSFLTASSQGDQVLQDITNTAVFGARRPRQANPSLMQKNGVRSRAVTHSDSEDELCI